MIREIDEALVEALRKEMAEIMPAQGISVGPPAAGEGPGLGLVSTGFLVEEHGIGSSKAVEKEEVTDVFEANGETKDFALKQMAVKPLLAVEAPPGTPRGEPADYTVDYVKGVVSFREAPPKAKKAALVRYNVARATGEVAASQTP